MVRRWTFGVGGCALVVAGLFWALSAKDGALELSERTDVMAMVCAVVGMVGMFATIWRSPGADDDVTVAVARLAHAVREAGEPQWRQSLGGDLMPIDVTFRFRPQAGGRAAALPAAPALQLARVVEDFREIRPRRLVITGEPGAGKTVLARKLVMELNRVRTEQEPVAVMIALADWDEDEPLDRWIVRHLERDYGISRSSARQVLRARMVLPVLDGLDEMDTAVTPADRRRAKAALEALDLYQDGTDAAPLVLTCRTEEYDAFEAEGRHILDSARIEIDPVTPDRAYLFLSRRGAARRPVHWQTVLDRLSAEPAGVLAQSLSTPWRLTLAATVYEPDGDPVELLTATTTDGVADLLLARYVAAATRGAPGRYASDDVHRRLAVLARALGVGSGAETDLALLELGRRIRPWQLGTVWWGVAGALAVGSGVTAYLEVRGFQLVFLFALLMPVAIVLLPKAFPQSLAPMTSGVPPFGSALWRVGFQLMLRHPRRTDVSPLLVVVMLLAGVWAGLPGWPYGEVWQVVVLAAVAVVLWCVMEAGRWIETAACGPTGVLRSAALLGGYLTLLVALLALCMGFIPFAAMIMCWIALLLMGWCREHVGYISFVLWNSRRLPLRLAPFLDWCVSAGLMRTSGVAYQFRHREFQEWLVRHPEPAQLP